MGGSSYIKLHRQVSQREPGPRAHIRDASMGISNPPLLDLSPASSIICNVRLKSIDSKKHVVRHHLMEQYSPRLVALSMLPPEQVGTFNSVQG